MFLQTHMAMGLLVVGWPAVGWLVAAVFALWTIAGLIVAYGLELRRGCGVWPGAGSTIVGLVGAGLAVGIAIWWGLAESVGLAMVAAATTPLAMLLTAGMAMGLYGVFQAYAANGDRQAAERMGAVTGVALNSILLALTVVSLAIALAHDITGPSHRLGSDGVALAAPIAKASDLSHDSTVATAPDTNEPQDDATGGETQKSYDDTASPSTEEVVALVKKAAAAMGDKFAGVKDDAEQDTGGLIIVFGPDDYPASSVTPRTTP